MELDQALHRTDHLARHPAPAVHGDQAAPNRLDRVRAASPGVRRAHPIRSPWPGPFQEAPLMALPDAPTGTPPPSAPTGPCGPTLRGRKRHLVVDTRGLLLFVKVTPASAPRQPRGEGSPLPTPPHARRDHHRLSRLRLRGQARSVGEEAPQPHDRHGQRSERLLRPHRAAPPPGRRTDMGLDDARPPARARLRTARPGLPNPGHLGRRHPHDPPPHPVGCGAAPLLAITNLLVRPRERRAGGR